MSVNGARKGVTVAVDAMGGDNAPDAVIRGAIDASQQGVGIVLVGPEQDLQRRLANTRAKFPIHDARDIVGMSDSVGLALRKEDSSLAIAMRLVAEGKADAAVSAGNSAAIMAVAIRELGMQHGIDRPAFGGSMPSGSGSVFVLDIGANASVKAPNLVQFAIMGEVYLQVHKGVESPRIALLSNGTESSKGTKAIREAYEVLSKSDLNFVGNIEGNHVFDGVADVIVCDGFAGNVLLKTAEGVAVEIFHLLKQEVEKDLVARVAAAALMPTLQRLRRRIDYEEVGGVPVLGVDGVVINCHGRSSPFAICNGIMQAQQMAGEHLVERIGEALRHESAEAGRRRRLTRALHLRPSPS